MCDAFSADPGLVNSAIMEGWGTMNHIIQDTVAEAWAVSHAPFGGTSPLARRHP